MFKEEIAIALKTKFKSFGLSNEAIDRIASAKEKTVTEKDQVETAIADAETMGLIAGELQKMRDAEIQKRADTQRAFDAYKEQHPGNNDDGGEGGDGDSKEPKPIQEDIAKIISEAVAAAVKPVQEAFDAFKSQTSAKEAKTLAKNKFYENKWTTKFKDEADDAWERADELNEAKGGNMTADELSGKATEYFNKLVQRKGADATKPFEAEGEGSGNFDFSAQAKHLEQKGLLPTKEQ